MKKAYLFLTTFCSIALMPTIKGMEVSKLQESEVPTANQASSALVPAPTPIHHITKLPYDVLGYLAQFFDNLADLAHFAQTNKYISEVMKSALQRPEVLLTLVGPKLYKDLSSIQCKLRSNPQLFNTIKTWAGKYSQAVLRAHSSENLTKQDAINFGKLYRVMPELNTIIHTIANQVEDSMKQGKAWSQLTMPLDQDNDLELAAGTANSSRNKNPQFLRDKAAQSHIALGILQAHEKYYRWYHWPRDIPDHVATSFKRRIENFVASYDKLNTALSQPTITSQINWEIENNYFDINFDDFCKMNVGDSILGLRSGYTLLHQAAHKNLSSLTEWLLTQGANHTLRDKGGNTALHVAAHNGHIEIARLLVQKCPPEVLLSENNNGLTPLAVAIKQGHNEIITLLMTIKPSEQLANIAKSECPLSSVLRTCNKIHTAKVFLMRYKIPLAASLLCTGTALAYGPGTLLNTTIKSIFKIRALAAAACKEAATKIWDTHLLTILAAGIATPMFALDVYRNHL